MSRTVARYAVTFGLSGCYMPNDVWHFECATRRDLATIIRSELENHEMPASLFKQVRIRRLWAFIARNGSSVAHFSLDHEGYSLGFHGMTEDEAAQAEREDA